MSQTATDTLAKKSRSDEVISGGHLVAKALKNEGVDTIFTLCGGHIIDIYDGCLDEGIRIVDVRHEQTAAHAADGYARQTGKLGCVVTTAGPGCTNAMTGIATAFRSESPVLHIGGQSSLMQHKMGSLQDLPHVEMMTPITKFAAGVMSTERVADMISMAARECFSGAYGPSYLEIPRDVLDKEIPVETATVPKPGHYRASVKSIGPATPAAIVGLNAVPGAGEALVVMDTDREVRELAEKRAEYDRAKVLSKSTKATLDDLSALIAEGQLKALPVIIKADVQGSLEAIKGSLEKLRNEEVKVNIIHKV